MRQKGEPQNGCSRKQSTPNFPNIKRFLPPDTHTYVCVSGGKKCSFFGKFGVVCFLETPGLRFALLPYYRQIRKFLKNLKFQVLIIALKKLRKFSSKMFRRKNKSINNESHKLKKSRVIKVK